MKDMNGRSIAGNSVVELYGGGRWHGFRASVLSISGDTHLWLSPLSDRPDGNGKSKFRWPVDRLTVIN